MKSSKSGRKECYFCGKRISERFNFCKQCTKEHGLANVPFSEWPSTYKDLVLSLNREHYQDIQYNNRVLDLEVDGEEAAWVQQCAYSDWAITDPTTLEEVLDEYDITEDEYDIIITDNLKMLAKNLSIGYSAAKMRRKRLLEKLRIEHPERNSLNIKSTESE